MSAVGNTEDGWLPIRTRVGRLAETPEHSGLVYSRPCEPKPEPEWLNPWD